MSAPSSAVQYHLSVIDEAVHHLPAALRLDATWRPYLELRDHLARAYFRLDRARVAELAAGPIDALEAAVRARLSDH